MASVETRRQTPLSSPVTLSLVPIPRIRKTNFARDLQDRLGILALLALSSPFRICKLQIPLATRETDPVSVHHIFNNLQAHRATITFQNVPTARRSRSTPTPWIVGEYRNVFGSVETRKSSRRTFSAAYRRDCERWKPYSYFLAGAETGSVFRYLMVIVPLIDIRQPRPAFFPSAFPHALHKTLRRR